MCCASCWQQKEKVRPQISTDGRRSGLAANQRERARTKDSMAGL